MVNVHYVLIYFDCGCIVHFTSINATNDSYKFEMFDQIQ